MPDEPYIIECPYCHLESLVPDGDDRCHADDDSDGSMTECYWCDREFRLVARHEVWFAAMAVEENEHGER